MGATISNYLYKKSTRLADEYIDDGVEFRIAIKVYTATNLTDQQSNMLLDYMQYTQPAISYIFHNSLILIYKPSYRSPFFRSNVACDIISYLSSELAIWMIHNKMPEPRMIGIAIDVLPYEQSVNDLIKRAKEDYFLGKIYGLENIAEDKIKEFCNRN